MGDSKKSGAIRQPPPLQGVFGTLCALFLISANCIDGLTFNFKMLFDNLEVEAFSRHPSVGYDLDISNFGKGLGSRYIAAIATQSLKLQTTRSCVSFPPILRYSRTCTDIALLRFGRMYCWKPEICPYLGLATTGLIFLATSDFLSTS